MEELLAELTFLRLEVEGRTAVELLTPPGVGDRGETLWGKQESDVEIPGERVEYQENFLYSGNQTILISNIFLTTLLYLLLHINLEA